MTLEALIGETMLPDIPVISRGAPADPAVARAVLGLADLPTIVAIGPFDDFVHAQHLAAAFTVAQPICRSQLVLLGSGTQQMVTRRAVPHSAAARVHLFDDPSEQVWCDALAAADFVMLGPTSGPGRLLDVLAAGRAVIAPADPETVRLVVPSSAGLVYRPGDVSRMAAAVSRLLTTPQVRSGMASRATEVAHRNRLQRCGRHHEGNRYE